VNLLVSVSVSVSDWFSVIGCIQYILFMVPLFMSVPLPILALAYSAEGAPLRHHLPCGGEPAPK